MGLLEYPQYTRPASFRGMDVPDVLLKGVHKDIEAWRRSEALKITRERRPEMLETAPLTDADRETLRRMERADEIIRNTYRTLLTRGMKGCYVYCTDPGMKAYMGQRLLTYKERIRELKRRQT